MPCHSTAGTAVSLLFSHRLYSAPASNTDFLFGTQTRADVQAIKERLDTGMTALASAVAGNTTYAAQQLDDLKPLVLPLLASPIVGEGSAYDAAYALARCLPGALHDAAFAVATALQLVMQTQLEGEAAWALLLCLFLPRALQLQEQSCCTTCFHLQ